MQHIPQRPQRPLGAQFRASAKSQVSSRKTRIYNSHPCLVVLTLLGLIASTPASAQFNNPALNVQPSSVPAATDASYILGAGDRIRVDFFNVPEYSGEFQVLPNGVVNLPQVGSVSVQGQTLKQASDTIAARFAPYLQQPLVTISLLASRPVKVAIAGEVSRPGSYLVNAEPTGNNTGVPTVTRIIQLAGGITQSANVRAVQIRRLSPQSQTAGETMTVDLWQLLRTGDITQDLALRDGDSIFIPPTTDVNLDEASQLASASFAPSEARPIKIAVVGQVNRPGPYIISGSTDNQQGLEVSDRLQIPTITKAIQVAGGITQSADIRNIQLRRRTKSGTDQVATINFWQLLQGGDLRQDLPLQEGDTIVIPEATTMTAAEATEIASASFSPDVIKINVVGEVIRPGTVEVPPNTPLNQALLAAGGFNNRRARKSTVTLVRLNPDGTVAQQSIPVDFAQGISSANNPALRNNDTIIVGRSGLAGLSDTVGNVLSPLTGVFGLFRLLGL